MNLKKVEKIAKELGITNLDKDDILKLKADGQSDKKVLEINSGTLSSKQPWFVVDETNDSIYQLVTSEASVLIMKTLKSVMQENMRMKLEKLIMQELPLDFNDVWAVAINQLENKISSPLDLNLSELNNLEKIVKDIKKEHPNLFLDGSIKDLFEQERDI